jgi:hypothetical protein
LFGATQSFISVYTRKKYRFSTVFLSEVLAFRRNEIYGQEKPLSHSMQKDANVHLRVHLRLIGVLRAPEDEETQDLEPRDSPRLAAVPARLRVTRREPLGSQWRLAKKI